MFKLVLEKAEETEIKMPISVGSPKKQEVQKNIYFSFNDYAKPFDCVENYERDGNTKPPSLPPEKPICGSRSNS